MFTTETIATLAIGGGLGVIIPIIAVIVYKKKNPDSWLPSAFIGVATFIVFAMILETLLHQVMLPIVQGNIWLYGIYGAFAAGFFEETGRFVAYKTLMRKRLTLKNGIMMGLGHGGFEAITLLGISYLAYLAMAISANNAGGIMPYLEAYQGTVPDSVFDTTKQTLMTIGELKLVNVIAPVYERIIAMTFHVCMSIWGYKAASQKGKVWLYPAAILAHAVLDFVAVLFQVEVITSVLLLYVIITLIVAAAVFVTVKMCKRD